MKVPARLLTLLLITTPAVPALAASATAAPRTVMRYTFDAGPTATGRIADTSGAGAPLVKRTVDGGTIRFLRTATGRYVGFPAPCARTATRCPRALFEAPDDNDLDPGTAPFRWGATVYVKQWQVLGSSNIMQKGVSDTESQWKLQVGANRGKAHCVVVGRGSSQAYVARSTISVADGVWHRVLCRRSGGVLTVYIDGVDRGHVIIPPTLEIGNNMPMRIGGPNFNTTSDMYHGYLDNVVAVAG
ncbi:concanavalin A-like lectin/glucanase superfamily protein [Krasilnikovia cinnamomea]|uniref:Concanavalin A-like lectin/glucanase superfamily protein n=1 Tax=Krasilnikovia cinnamomea TaxID=349313 RepID=A0A4Q7ZD71_9ACTN|nr:LamG-like jellyroll fold domain-containing protein [Krasilnikovia cinnamomea]RZU48610.1 concanavalin A-like lectin/glucanase superfamily protein [Krasilnikovia cinnamomea]